MLHKNKVINDLKIQEIRKKEQEKLRRIITDLDLYKPPVNSKKIIDVVHVQKFFGYQPSKRKVVL